MASIANDPAGRKRIIFYDKNGNRKAIRLGKCSKKTAEEVRTRVESLNAAIIAGCSIDGDTAAWLGKIGNALHARIAKAGLTTPRESPKQTRLGDFIESYISGRTDVQPRTITNLRAAQQKLVEFFGTDKTLEEITTGDAKAWVIWLKGPANKGRGYAKATTGRAIKFAKQFFHAAIDHELVSKDPFRKVKPPAQANEARKFFIDRETTSAVLEACPDAEWRLLFALSRFGGLRCPSEHLALTWPDVDLASDRFRVDSPKTGVRWVPIFPELRPYLEDALELAADKKGFVINRYRDVNKNLRTQLGRILRRAGLEPWPKLFHNLRGSRETELAADYPLHVVCAWIGNRERVAQKHYLTIPDSYFTQAAEEAAQNPAPLPQKRRKIRRATEHPPGARRTKKPRETRHFQRKTPHFPGLTITPGGIRTPNPRLRRPGIIATDLRPDDTPQNTAGPSGERSHRGPACLRQ